MICEECGAPFAGRAGQRFCSRPCRNRFHNARRPSEAGAPRRRRPRAGTPPPRRRATPAPVGTRRWMHDPSVPCCPVDGCFLDYPCARHGRRKT